MAKEIQAVWTSGRTLYAQLLNATGSIWKTTTSTFVSYSTADYTDYDIALTEQGTASQIYMGDMPAAAAGVYHLIARERAGASPAESDTIVGVGTYQWDGSALLPLSTIT